MGAGHATAAGRHKKPLYYALALTGSFMAVEVIGGLLTGSLALLADAAHMLTDVGGLVLALVAIRFSERPATPEQTSAMSGSRSCRRWPMRSCCCC